LDPPVLAQAVATTTGGTRFKVSNRQPRSRGRAVAKKAVGADRMTQLMSAVRWAEHSAGRQYESLPAYRPELRPSDLPTLSARYP